LSKAVLTLTLLALSACAARKDPYVVGAAGPWKQGYGLQNLQGVQLAAEEINKAGGINGHAFQVIERDDEGDGALASKIAQEFVRNRKISAVIGHVNSSGMLASARIYDGRLAAVATSATSPDLTGISSWVFRIISSDSLNGVALATFASRFSVHNADLPTAEPYIAYLKMRKPKIVFVAGRVASGLKILQEAKRQGFTAAFIGGDGWQGIVSDTAVAEGAYVGMSFTPEDPSPAARAFVAAFEKKFGTPPDAHAALAYDATRLIAQALKDRGPDRTRIRNYLRSLTVETAYVGLTGRAYFEDTGDPVGMRFKVLRVHNALLTVAAAR
jgi:branched-chain amino acid transport system substrate-binding protein